MTKAIAVLAMLLMTGSAAALERSLDGRGVMGGHGSADRQAGAQRGDRAGGDKDRTIFGREVKSRGSFRPDRGGRRGDRG